MRPSIRTVEPLRNFSPYVSPRFAPDDDVVPGGLFDPLTLAFFKAAAEMAIGNLQTALPELKKRNFRVFAEVAV